MISTELRCFLPSTRTGEELLEDTRITTERSAREFFFSSSSSSFGFKTRYKQTIYVTADAPPARTPVPFWGVLLHRCVKGLKTRSWRMVVGFVARSLSRCARWVMDWAAAIDCRVCSTDELLTRYWRLDQSFVTSKVLAPYITQYLWGLPAGIVNVSRAICKLCSKLFFLYGYIGSVVMIYIS